MQGINRKILKVNLTEQQIEIQEPPEEFYRKYIGGRGFALYYMLKDIPARVDPFSPNNILVFASSIIGGAPGPAIPRLVVCSKSPLTDRFGESESGGFWAPELKIAGFDAIVITGKAKHPVYLWIKDGEVEFRTASHLWGKVTGDVQKIIRNELNDQKIRIAQIGPGGENLVRYANITNELAHFNGRTGLGAVMGSKNLKAIAVRGTGKIKVANKEKIIEISRWTAKEGIKKPLASALHETGTPAVVEANNEMGVLPTRNWTKSIFSDADKISGEAMKNTIGKKPHGCFACPIRCKRTVEVNEDNLKVESIYGGPEYETLASLGSLLEINDLKIIAKANELCNKFTIDTISTGMTIAFIMECYEKGIFPVEEYGDLKLEFGNSNLLLDLIEKIANRDGIGDLLAEGSLRASKSLGPTSEKFVHHVKGQEIPMHDPRVKAGVGLQYALADYGADHMKAAHDSFYANKEAYGTSTTRALGIFEPVDPLSLGEDKVRLFVLLDIYWTMLDMLGVCHFGYAPRGSIPISMLIDLVQAVSGTDISLWELMKASERSINLAHIFNLREGFTPEEDKLPELFYSELKEGPFKGNAIARDEFETAVKLRYQIMGWDENTTKPARSKLIELDIDWVHKYLD